MLSMEDVLGYDKLFREKFCAAATLRNLGAVPVDALRETVSMIHRASGFRAAATPEFWTPDGSEQPVVVFGRPTIAGAMQGFRFGLSTDVRGNGQPRGEKLFLWVPEAKVRLVSDNNRRTDLRFVSSWLPWRHDKNQANRAMPVPLYEQGMLLDDTALVAGFNDQVTLGMFLALLGSQLNLRREVIAEFEDITSGIGLSANCITPRAAEIMKDLRR
jgi:hypothetical protein